MEESCPDPSYCFGLDTCACKPGFSGIKCLKRCDLSCVPDHGVCVLGKELNSEKNESQFCNCLPEWEGQFCEIEKVDPKVAASRAREKEESVRVMAGVLAAAAAVALCVAIATPIILWRLRVIFVLKLIYFFKPYEDDESKMYDAYVSMTPTSNAEKFVYTELSPKLENLGFKLYIQSRDSLPGEVLSEGILEAVEKSRCTIMIVTQDYIKNEWNRFEYLIAQEESLKLRQKIIPIILEKLEKDATLDKALKHILDSVKCIRYPQQKSSQPTEESAQSPSDISPSIQSPSVIKLLNNSLFKKSSERNNVDSSSHNNKQDKLFKAEEKFWKCLELTMPKIKRQNNMTNIDSKKQKSVKANLYQQQSYNSYNIKTMETLDAKFTDIQLNEIVLE
ncbi:hypothetical protein Btru_026154 [Bulinus truncatus]|nr:hypothetical protein Btru_026154 [Bulinus truncatus]